MSSDSMLNHPLYFQAFNSTNAAFNVIDQQIKALQESSRSLSSFRNTWTPIHQLPSEVLILIFSSLQQPWFEDSTIEAKPKYLQWVVVTHVCQQWRNVALGSPCLWTYISSSYPSSAIKESLLRSNTLPLIISIQHRHTDEEGSIFNAMNRVRHLTISMGTYPSRSADFLLRPAAPILETLTVRVPQSSYEEAFTVPKHPFSGNFPRLRHLTLQGCYVKLNSPIFNGITTLELATPVEIFEVAELLTFLRRLPQLVSLTISDVFEFPPFEYDIGEQIPPEPIPPKVPSDFGIVHLPSVSYLSVTGRNRDPEMDFLSHVSFPATSTIHCTLGAYTWEIATSTLWEFLRLLQLASHDRFTAQITSITLTCLEDIHLMCKSGNHDALDLTLKGYWPNPSPQDATRMLDAFSSLSTSGLTSLTTDCPFSIQDWKTLDASFPILAYIQVQKDGATNFLDFFNGDYRANGTSDTTESINWTPVLPNLVHLHIHEVLIEGKDRSDLPKTAAARKQMGKGLDVVGIEKCKMFEADFIEALKGVVNEKVEWDGSMGIEPVKDYGPWVDPEDYYGW